MAAKKKPQRARKSARRAAEANVTNAFVYKGVEVKVAVGDQEERLLVGGEPVSCYRDADTGAYIPDEAPFERYGSIEELAKARIDRQQGGR